MSAKPASLVKEPTTPLAQTGKNVEKALTSVWKDTPTWMQDNHYIQSGYRTPSSSYAKSAASIRHVHNESVNIWTHLIGALVAGITAITLYVTVNKTFEKATSEDLVVFSYFFLGAFTCLAMSATFHTISNHSEAVQKFGNRLDYFGIVFLIWGSFMPSIYYGFEAHVGLVRLHWSVITAISVGTIVVIMHPKFRSAEWRPFRAFMFVMMGLSAIVPIVHGIHVYGYDRFRKQIGLSFVVSQGLLYIGGAVIYAARIPERWRPGAFDIWGSSHQIFHVLVLLAATTHLVGLLKAFESARGGG